MHSSDLQQVLVHFSGSHCYEVKNFQSWQKYADKSYADLLPYVFSLDGENISFDARFVIYIKCANIPPIMIINRI